MLSLQTRGIIKAMEFNSFTRIHHEDTEIKVINFQRKLHSIRSGNKTDESGDIKKKQYANEIIIILGRQANANHCIE